MAKDYKNKKGATGKKYTTVGDVIKVTYTDGSTRVVRPTDASYAVTKKAMQDDISSKKLFKNGNSKTTAQTALGANSAGAGVVTTAKQKAQQDNYRNVVNQRRAQEQAVSGKLPAQQTAQVVNNAINAMLAQKAVDTAKGVTTKALKSGVEHGVHNTVSGLNQGMAGALNTLGRAGMVEGVPYAALANNMAKNLDIQRNYQKAMDTQRIGMGQLQKNLAMQDAVKRQQIANKYGPMTGGEQFVSDIVSNLIPIAPSMAAGVIGGGVAPALGTVAAMAPMYTYARGLSTGQALQDGATVNQANAYGIGKGMVETGTEMLTKNMAGLPGKFEVGKKLADAVTNPTAKKVGAAAGDILSGAGEEALAELADPFLQNATYKDGEKIDMDAVLYSALLGGVMTGGVNAAAYTAKNVAKMMQEAKNGQLNGQNEAQIAQKPQNTPEQAQNNATTKGITAQPEVAQEQSSQADFQQNQAKIVQEAQPVKNVQNGDKKAAFTPLETVAEQSPMIETENAAAEEPSMVEYEDYDARKLSRDVFDFYSQVGKVGGKAHFNIRVVQKLEHDAEGKSDGRGNILISAERANDIEIIRRVVAHEVYHEMKNTPEWGNIQDLAYELYKLKYPDGTQEDMLQAKVDQYYKLSKGAVQLDFDAAWDEIGAEMMGKILSNPKMADRVWNQNPTLAQRIKRWLEDMVSKFRNTSAKNPNAEIYRKALDAYSRGLRNMQQQNRSQGEGRYALVGKNADEIEVYETSEDIKKLPYSERKKEFLRLMQEEYAGRTARFTVNGENYYARFAEEDLTKNVYGDKRSSPKGWKAKINVGADGGIFDLVENAKYKTSGDEKGKTTKAHKDVKDWDYFVKTVQIDNHVFDLLVNVRKKPDGEFVYSLQLNENKTKKASLPVANPEGNGVRMGAQRSRDIIPENEQKINTGTRYSLPKKMPNQKYIDQSDENLRNFMEGSAVVNKDGSPKVVYSGHGNTNLFGTSFDKKRATAGGFYFTANPDIASNYAKDKLGVKEYYENGDEYRIKNEKGQYKLKLQDIRLTDDQVEKFDEWFEEDLGWTYEDFVNERGRYDSRYRNLRYLGGKRSLYNLHWLMEELGYTLSQANYTKDGVQYSASVFEELMDAMGIEWDSYTQKSGGVFPIYLSIKNPIDTSKPFPDDVMKRLERIAAREKRMTWEELDEAHWTANYPVYKWIEDIKRMEETGEETYWATQVPTKARKILQEMGYDGIKDTGGKMGGEEHEVWIAFEPTQVKSAIGNRGTYDATKKDMRYSLNTKDTAGRKLTAGQQEYFKDSKVRDENGNLKKVYHGSPADFNVFDFGKVGKNGTAEGYGFYFTDNKELADEYKGTGNTREFYVDIQKPLYKSRSGGFAKWELEDIANEYASRKNIDSLSKEDIDYFYNYLPSGVDILDAMIEKLHITDNADVKEFLNIVTEQTGYDGIISEKYNSNMDDYEHIYVVFDSNRAKLTDNENPTSNPDIRYSMNRLGGNSGKSRYQELVDKYGAIKPGENPFDENRDIPVPQQTSDWDKTRQWTRTAMESGNIDDTTVGMIASDLTDDMQTGRFIYEPTSNREQVGRANRLIQHTGWQEQAQNFRNKYRSGERMTADDIALGEVLILEAQRAGDYDTAVQLIADVAALGTEAGRAVQALKILKRLSPEGRVMALKRIEARINASLIKQGKEPIALPEGVAQQMLQARGEDKQTEIWDNAIKAMAEQVPATFADKVNAWRYLSMLSNPRTHIRNMMGNAVMRSVMGVKNLMQTGVEAALAKNSERTAAILVPKEYRDFAKWDYENHAKQMLAAGGGRYNDEIGLIAQNKRIFNNPALEGARKLNSGALEFEDMLFKKAAYIDALSRYMYANKLSPSVLQSQASAVGASYERGQNFAVEQARKATFQEASKLAQKLAEIENMNNVSKVFWGAVMPFKKTPINILKRGIEYSPLGVMNGVKKFATDVRSGKATPAEAIDELTAGMTGTMIVALGYYMASQGLLSGGADDDDQRKARYDQQMGNQNYAFVFPDGSTYTIDWLAPSVMPLMVGAELHKQMNGNVPDNDNATVFTRGLEAIAKVGNPVMEMSMLSGLTDALQSYNSGTGQFLSDVFMSAASNYGGQFIPAPMGAVARAIDGTVRSSYAPKDSPYTKGVETFARQQANKIPVVSQHMQPSVDVWGNERKREGDTVAERLLHNMFNPGNYSSNKRTELDDKLKELYENSGVSTVLPTTAANYVSYNGENYHLDAEEKTRFAKTQGQKSQQYVSSFVNSDAYGAMNDTKKAEIVTKLYNLAKYEAKQELFPDFVDSEYQKVLDSKMDPGTYYVTKEALSVIADNVSKGEKAAKIEHLKQLKNSGVITDEQFWYLRRSQIGQFSKAEKASCPYEWIRNM